MLNGILRQEIHNNLIRYMIVKQYIQIKLDVSNETEHVNLIRFWALKIQIINFRYNNIHTTKSNIFFSFLF